MIISNSSIGMDSTRVHTSVSKEAYTRTKSVITMSANEFTDSLNSAYQDINKKTDNKEETKEKEGDADTLSNNTGDSLEYLKGKFNEISISKLAAASKRDEDLKAAIRYMLLNFLLMLLIGKNGGKDMDSALSDAMSDGSSSEGLSVGYNSDSLEFYKISETVSMEQYYSDYEKTTFNAKGTVKTADGRDIDIGIDITMSRRFEAYAKERGVLESFGMKLCDPLVINFGDNVADISDQKFYFDLDQDGIKDEISRLGVASGFLALDLNEDGEINDGSELFGTKSSDGFKDLSKYDEDGNGWIDEADEIYDKLRILCFEEDGSTTQYKLKDKNVGAIYLGNKDTEFSVTNQENKLNAQVRKTGIFLYETGETGSLQHVDLAIELGA